MKTFQEFMINEDVALMGTKQYHQEAHHRYLADADRYEKLGMHDLAKHKKEEAAKHYKIWSSIKN